MSLVKLKFGWGKLDHTEYHLVKTTQKKGQQMILIISQYLSPIISMVEKFGGNRSHSFFVIHRQSSAIKLSSRAKMARALPEAKGRTAAGNYGFGLRPGPCPWPLTGRQLKTVRATIVKCAWVAFGELKELAVSHRPQHVRGPGRTQAAWLQLWTTNTS